MTARPGAAIDRVTLVVADLDRAEDDYVQTLGCSVEQRGDIDPSLTGVLCLRQARGRRSLLRLGRERIELLEFTDSAGRPYPADSTSTDIWFQHMAIVVNDMRHAYQLVMANRRLRPISRNGPVRLPESSGAVTAFKFRDYDGHPLELLAFPAGRVPGEWRGARGTGPFLGVDHTAIGVSDSARSARFFGSVFGFSTGPRTENRGPEQAELDNVDDVQVSVTRLAPDRPAPRLELLHYRVGTRRPIPRDTASNDIAATHCVVRVASLDATAAALTRYTPLAADDFMILRGGVRAALVWGPDGHRFLVQERAAAAAGAAPGPAQARTPALNPGYWDEGRLWSAQLGQPGEVDAGHVLTPDQHHEDAAAGPAADDGAGSPPVDDELSHRPAGTARAAAGARGSHFPAEDVDQQAADRVAVQRVHHCPPVDPNRSVFTRSGG
jgi:catechol 2,3-dioxygenase-like lactoylglutathione lyase family enzyme